MPNFQTRVPLQDLVESTFILPPQVEGGHNLGHHKTQTGASGRKHAHPIRPLSPLKNL